MHLTNVQQYTKQIALQYGYTESEANILGDAAALHDIGKIMIPSEILHKKGSLNKEELEIMHKHTIYGADLIDSFCGTNEDCLTAIIAQDIALHHHERWDGNGYPEKLKGNEISIASQIVGIADCFDALLSERCYKSALSPEISRDMILNNECGVFSDIIKTAFINFFEEKYYASD